MFPGQHTRNTRNAHKSEPRLAIHYNTVQWPIGLQWKWEINQNQSAGSDMYEIYMSVMAMIIAYVLAFEALCFLLQSWRKGYIHTVCLLIQEVQCNISILFLIASVSTNRQIKSMALGKAVRDEPDLHSCLCQVGFTWRSGFRFSQQNIYYTILWRSVWFTSPWVIFFVMDHCSLLRLYFLCLVQCLHYVRMTKVTKLQTSL